MDDRQLHCLSMANEARARARAAKTQAERDSYFAVARSWEKEAERFADDGKSSDDLGGAQPTG